MQGQRYALVHDGQVFISLSRDEMRHNWETATVLGRWGDETQTLARRKTAGVWGDTWFAGAAEAAPDEVIIHLPVRQRTVGYRLEEERLADRMPATLTVEEYAALTDDESERYDPIVHRVYTALTEAVQPDPILIRGFVRLDGQPWPETNHEWIADLPHQLSEDRRYLHLFPGRIAEPFKEALCELLKTRSDVSYCFDKPGHLDVTVNVGQVSRTLELRPPWSIGGPTFRDALEEWDAQVRLAFAAVEELSSQVCPTCAGSGTTVPAPARPKRRRR